MFWLLFGLYFIACIAAASTGALFSPGAWYDALQKPRWTPPNWLFPLAWTVLYLAMAYAAALVSMSLHDASDGLTAETTLLVQLGLALWALQIALNTLWTPVFFGRQKLGGGLFVMAGLWFSVAAATLVFWQITALAGLLFLPYLLWVSYAAALNFAVWRMNAEAVT